MYIEWALKHINNDHDLCPRVSNGKDPRDHCTYMHIFGSAQSFTRLNVLFYSVAGDVLFSSCTPVRAIDLIQFYSLPYVATVFTSCSVRFGREWSFWRSKCNGRVLLYPGQKRVGENTELSLIRIPHLSLCYSETPVYGLLFVCIDNEDTSTPA